jgi:hypothetical protein
MNISLAVLRLTLMISFCFSPVGSAASAQAAAIDPKPPHVTVNFIFPPSPLIQHGTARLVYEMVITNYVPPAYSYYNEVRTHLSLDKDAPDFRRAQKFGRIAAIPILGGIHHQYVRV